MQFHLAVSRGDVIHDGVTKDVRRRLVLGDMLARLADHDSELGFIVEFPRYLAIPQDIVTWADDASGRYLDKKFGFLGSDFRLLLAVISIVLAAAKDDAGIERPQQTRAVERYARSIRSNDLLQHRSRIGVRDDKGNHV